KYIARLLEQVNNEAPYVTNLFVWNLNLRTAWPETDERYGFGILDANGSPLPAYTCAADFVRSGNRITRPECRSYEAVQTRAGSSEERMASIAAGFSRPVRSPRSSRPPATARITRRITLALRVFGSSRGNRTRPGRSARPSRETTRSATSASSAGVASHPGRR